MSNNYEEVFIPELIRDPRFEKSKIIHLEPKNADAKALEVKALTNNVLETKASENNEIELYIKPIEAKIYLKNYFRLIAHCDKINIYLYLDLIGNRSKLNKVYDRYGRVRRGVYAKLSPECKQYRLINDVTGESFILQLQKIYCNVDEIIVGYIYSVYKDSEEPVKVGITYL